MSQAEINNLDLLQPNSGQRLPGVAIASSIPSNGIKLCRPKMLANASCNEEWYFDITIRESAISKKTYYNIPNF